VAAPKTSAATQSDLERLRGTWLVVALEAGGRSATAARLQAIKLRFMFDGSKLTTRRTDQPGDRVVEISLEPSANPKRMTLKRADGLGQALYAIEGNKLRLCIMVDENPNAGFPKDFVSRPSPTTDSLTLERQ
jgi:uncharacterized protein (TIGR03067 family)